MIREKKNNNRLILLHITLKSLKFHSILLDCTLKANMKMARLKKYCFLAGYLPISFSQYLLQANLSVITKYKILKLTNEKDIDDTRDNQDQNL